MSHKVTATLPPTLLPLGPFSLRRVTPAPAAGACGWNRCLGRGCWSGAAAGGVACVDVEAPTRLIVATEPHTAVGNGLTARGYSAARCAEGAALAPTWGSPVSDSPTLGATTWDVGMQEEGTGPCGDTVPHPCARRSGWQMLPMLAAVTHRCRLALLPGASTPLALHPDLVPTSKQG